MGIKFDLNNKTSAIAAQDSDSIWTRDIEFFGSSLSSKIKEGFYIELSTLLGSGINLKQAIDIIAETQKKEKHQKLFAELSNKIVGGHSFYQTLKETKDFTPYEYQAINIGEQTGKLKEITRDLAEFFARKNELKRELISSLSYPIIVLSLAVAVVVFMLWAVVPMFVDIFKQNQVELPWLTKQIVALSNFVTENFWLLLIATAVVVLCVKWLSKTSWFYRISGGIILRIPVLGNYLKKIYLIQFTQAMTLLIGAKIPVTESLSLIKEMIRFYPLEKSVDSIQEDILKGEKISQSFAKHSLYDKKMIALLRVAEETNQTEQMFKRIYDQYSSEIKYKRKIITSILNFVLILFVGTIVGVILVAMYLPMFKLSSAIG